MDHPASGLTVVLAGATGVVGRHLAEQSVARQDIARVVAPGRRALPWTAPGLSCPVLTAIDDETAWTEVMPGEVDLALCALGTTMRRAGSRAAFRKVDLEGVVAFAKAARARGARTFGLVSSLGADRPGAAFYLRIKHEAEQAVQQIGFERVVIVRPSFIDDEGMREDHRPLERLALPLARWLLPARGVRAKWAPVTARAIARGLLAHGLAAGPGLTVLENATLVSG
ncbi:MAG: NAD(P)H-binding protein [Candidatus Sericytochromatia bacterium]|nr:NAD(P)H-binding protein [Candidatus Sericytochromatia bacterium]